MIDNILIDVSIIRAARTIVCKDLLFMGQISKRGKKALRQVQAYLETWETGCFRDRINLEIRYAGRG